MALGASGLIYACMVKYSTQSHTPALWAGGGDNWKIILPVETPRNEDGGFTTIGGPDRDGWFYVTGYRIRDPERSLSAPAQAPQPLCTLSNSPNPFNASTVISFTLVENDIPCELNLYSSGGQLVCTLLAARLNCGPHAALWDGKDTRGRACPSGLYIARLDAGSRTAILKLLLVK